MSWQKRRDPNKLQYSGRTGRRRRKRSLAVDKEESSCRHPHCSRKGRQPRRGQLQIPTMQQKGQVAKRKQARERPMGQCTLAETRKQGRRKGTTVSSRPQQAARNRQHCLKNYMCITLNSVQFKYRKNKIKYDQGQVVLIYYEHDLLLYKNTQDTQDTDRKGKMDEASLNYWELHTIEWVLIGLILNKTERNYKRLGLKPKKNVMMPTIFQ